MLMRMVLGFGTFKNPQEFMLAFLALLVAMTVIIIIFTITAIADGGLDLIMPFVSPVLAMTWQGQFQVDFAMYLVLSGVWMAWRSGYSTGGLALGILTPVLGILFFAPYLLILTFRCQDDAKRLLLGVHMSGFAQDGEIARCYER